MHQKQINSAKEICRFVDSSEAKWSEIREGIILVFKDE